MSGFDDLAPADLVWGDHAVARCRQRLDHVEEVIAAKGLAMHENDRRTVGLGARWHIHIGHREGLQVRSPPGETQQGTDSRTLQVRYQGPAASATKCLSWSTSSAPRSALYLLCLDTQSDGMGVNPYGPDGRKEG
jgi:hypothetical protein